MKNGIVSKQKKMKNRQERTASRTRVHVTTEETGNILKNLIFASPFALKDHIDMLTKIRLHIPFSSHVAY